MKKYLLIPLILMSSACRYEQKSFDAAAQTSSGVTEVLRAKDGDTFEIAAPWSPFPDLSWSVRVRGIDTPEKGYLAKCSREKELATRASAFTKAALARSGNRVTLTNVKHDKFGGRFDADVTLADGTNLASALIAARFAKPYNGNGPKPNWCY